jgi:hypothetical protein
MSKPTTITGRSVTCKWGPTIHDKKGQYSNTFRIALPVIHQEEIYFLVLVLEHPEQKHLQQMEYNFLGEYHKSGYVEFL